MSELHDYARALIETHAHEVDECTIREAAPVHIGREISSADAGDVAELIQSARLAVSWPGAHE